MCSLDHRLSSQDHGCHGATRGNDLDAWLAVKFLINCSISLHWKNRWVISTQFFGSFTWISNNPWVVIATHQTSGFLRQIILQSILPICFYCVSRFGYHTAIKALPFILAAPWWDSHWLLTFKYPKGLTVYKYGLKVSTACFPCNQTDHW